MLIYKLQAPEGEVQVTLNSDQPNRSALVEFEGGSVAVSQVRNWLRREYGAFGHFIGNRTTPIDLAAAMSKPRAKIFSPKLVTGEELIAQLDPGLPPGAIS